MEQHSPPSLYSIAEEVIHQDHGILCGGGTSSNLERLPSRLQCLKTNSRSMKKQIEDLAYKTSYLKAELLWHSESKEALLQLQEQMYQLFHRMEDALIQVTARLQEAELCYLGLRGMTPIANTEEGGIWIISRKAGFGKVDWTCDWHDITVWNMSMLLYYGWLARGHLIISLQCGIDYPLLIKFDHL